MSLGLLLFGGALLGSAIKCGIQNADMMSSPYKYLDDGTPVYLDRKCQEWANGEKIVPTYDYKNQKLVYAGQRSGKVYVDPETIKRKKQEEWDEKHKQDAINRGKLAYLKYDPIRKRELTCEISTGKYIAKIVGTNLFNKQNPGKCWGSLGNPKYPNEIAARPEYKDYRKFYLDPNSSSDLGTIPGDEGIPITMEEFDKLNIVCGSHWAWDSYRDKSGRTPEDPYYNCHSVYVGCR